MDEHWDQLITRFEALELWALKSMKSRDDWEEKPEETPFFVAHAEFLYNNAQGMQEILPVLRDDRRLEGLDIGIENFIFFIALPELREKVVQIWSEEPEMYTICVLDIDELSPKHLDTFSFKEVPDALIEYLAHLETLTDTPDDE